MRIFRNFIALLFILTINIATSDIHKPSKGWVIDHSHIWRVEVVNDDRTRAKGLMYRPYLLPQYGMLFVFDQPRVVNFWMKNTWATLDMRFYDEKGQLITHYPYATPCVNKSCQLYSSVEPIKYVLETQSIFHLVNKASNLELILIDNE